ncbi:MAG: hypothetical protein Q9227_002266 [Pyrenula ochraceoflavens]
MPVPVVETNNILKHPEGPEFQFQVGEGTYVLRDDLHLATPPPHPSEAPVQNPNPLSTTPAPPTAGVKFSLVSVLPRKLPPQALYKTYSYPSDKQTYSIKETESRHSAEGSDSGNPPSTLNGSTPSSSAPAFGEGNIALSPVVGKEGKDVLKRRKPKTNIVKSNSSFVSRVIPHENLQRRLTERDQHGLFAFVNINRALQWLDLSSNTQQEPLAKILFTKAHMLCHDINEYTKNPSHIDLVLGSSAGDIIWYEPMSQKYARLNKNGVVNSSPVSHIQWIPGSENLFLASHMDGTLIVYDKEKEDAPFLAEENGHDEVNGGSSDKPFLNVTKSVNSKNQKSNPVACWKISNQPINNFAFSPDSRHLAVVSEDGCLRIVDYLTEKLTDVYPSYYGGLICVCWSPDGKYIATGGQDDLVSIWSLADRQLVARCQGHHSWVTAVAFDPWRCDERNYRFGSVGDDCKLLLWDFSVGMLHRPKGASAGRSRPSISTTAGGTVASPLQRLRTESTTRIRSNSKNSASGSLADGAEIEPEIVHAVEPRARTAQLPPVLSKEVDEHPLSGLAFEEGEVIVSCCEGHVRRWRRPGSDGGGDEGGEEREAEKGGGVDVGATPIG